MSEVSITPHRQLGLTCYTAVQTKNLLKSISVIQVATIKNMDNAKDTIVCTSKLSPFAVSKDEWNTKKDTGKSMKNALYVLWYAKKHLSA